MNKFPRDWFLKIFWISFYIFLFLFLLNYSFGYMDNDLGWHLKVGQEILETKNVPSINTYNYTLEGVSWVDHEWLINLFTFWVYDNFGYIALNIIFSFLVVLVFGLVHLFINKKVLKNKKGSYLVLFPFMLWGLWGSLPHLGVRVQEISLLNFVIILWIIHEFNTKRNYKILFILPFLFYFWACVHGGFLIGFCIIFSYLGLKLGEFLIFKFFKPEFIFKDKLLKIKDFFLFFFFGLLSLFVTFFTPYFLNLYTFLKDYWTNVYYLNHIEEWLGQYYLPLNYPQLLYIAFVSAILILIIIMFRQEKRVLEKLDWWWYFLTAVLVIMSFRSRRHFPLLFLTSLPLVASFLYYSFEGDFFYRKLKNKTNLINDFLKLLLIIIFIFLSFTTFKKINWVVNPFYYFQRTYPYRAVEFLKKHKEWSEYNLYNLYGWGGYLIWEYPEKKLFIDGRLPQYSFAGHTIMEEYHEFLKEEKVKEKLDKYDIRIVLISNSNYNNKYDWLEEGFLKDKNREEKRDYLKDYLENSKEWNKVFYNNTSVVYVKN